MKNVLQFILISFFSLGRPTITVKNYSEIQKCMDSIPANETYPIEDLGFDIWKNQAFIA